MNLEMLKNSIKNLCPQCREGEVFRDFFDMHKRCLNCGYLFKRGSGYFLGSLIINYTICAIFLMPIFLFLVIIEASHWVVIGFPLLLLLLLQPFMIRFSRVLWLHVDYKIATSKH